MGNTATVEGEVNLNAWGEIQLGGGNLDPAQGTYLSGDNPSGEIVGPGTIEGNVFNGGFLATGPGAIGQGTPPNVLHITGSYVQTYSASYPKLFMDIIYNGSTYDQLQVDGSITLGNGSNPTSGLEVLFEPFNLSAITFPNFISYSSLTGTFNISAIPSGYVTFYGMYGASSMTLTTIPPGARAGSPGVSDREPSVGPRTVSLVGG